MNQNLFINRSQKIEKTFNSFIYDLLFLAINFPNLKISQKTFLIDQQRVIPHHWKLSIRKNQSQ